MFKTVELNLLGWSTLIGAGLLLGAGLALASPLPKPAALASGVVVSWGSAMLLDRWRDRNSMIFLYTDLDSDSAATTLAELAAEGVEATLEERDADEEEGAVLGLLVRQRDLKTVQRLLSER